AAWGQVVGQGYGSAVADAYDWRSVSFMIVPAGIAALVCIWFALSDHTQRSRVHFDWTGFITLSVAIVSAQLIFDRGQRLDWFDSTEIVLLTAIGIVAFWMFLAHCMTYQ